METENTIEVSGTEIKGTDVESENPKAERLEATINELQDEKQQS